MLSRASPKHFDTDCSPIETLSVKWTSEGQVDKVHQTPSGLRRSTHAAVNYVVHLFLLALKQARVTPYSEYDEALRRVAALGSAARQTVAEIGLPLQRHPCRPRVVAAGRFGSCGGRLRGAALVPWAFLYAALWYLQSVAQTHLRRAGPRFTRSSCIAMCRHRNRIGPGPLSVGRTDHTSHRPCRNWI